MKDLSREEQIEQHIARLDKRISEMAVDCRKEKWLRTKITFFILSPLVYFIALAIANGLDIKFNLLGWLFFSPLIAIGVMLISYLVLGYIFDGVMKDKFAIGELIGRQDAIKLSKHDNRLDEKTKELKKRIEYLEDLQEKLTEENTLLKLKGIWNNDME